MAVITLDCDDHTHSDITALGQQRCFDHYVNVINIKMNTSMSMTINIFYVTFHDFLRDFNSDIKL